MPELRAEVPKEIMAVIDAICQSSGDSRTDLVVSSLSRWANEKINESILVCRVAGVNPTASERRRHGGGGYR